MTKYCLHPGIYHAIMQSKATSFCVDWDDPSICVKASDGTITSKKSDFAIELNALIEAGENTGYLANVQRAIDGTRK